MFKYRSTCRACNSPHLEQVFSLAVQPLANDFVKAGDEHQGFAPLEVMFCPKCTLAQLSVEVDPKILYSHYAYVTSTSDTMKRHFARLVTDIMSQSGVGTLLEIGSNDGSFLDFARERGFGPVCGIDPAQNLYADREQQVLGIFDEGTCHDAHVKLGAIDCVVARHVFCHINDWHSFFEVLAKHSRSKTLICIEVPWVVDLLRRVEFDSVYHEHTSYFSLRALQAILERTPFHIHNVTRYGIHGGSLLIMLRHRDSGITPTLNADEFLGEEHITAADWAIFGKAVRDNITALEALIDGIPDSAIICGFGASAKMTVLINSCPSLKKRIAFVTDNSPLKPGTLIPGTTIPVIEESQMLSEHPDYAVLGAWNFQSEIVVKNRKWLSRGGQFINPHTLEIIGDRLQLLRA